MEQAGVEAVEGIGWHVGKQLAREPAVIAKERLGGGASRLRFRGTHSGEFLGIPATGRAVEYVSHEFYRIADGLIAEEWLCSDMAATIRSTCS